MGIVYSRTNANTDIVNKDNVKVIQAATFVGYRTGYSASKKREVDMFRASPKHNSNRAV